MRVSFHDDELRFLSYEFRGASVCPNGVVTASQVRDADWTAIRPRLRTTLGETLFVPDKQRQDLESFCRRNAIGLRHGYNVWSDLLDPFLDTVFAPEDEAATMNRLNQAGLSPERVTEIRMDSMLWEWVELDLFDLLSAISGRLVPPELPATLGGAEEFYRWAMRIAEHQPPSPDHPTGDTPAGR